MAKTKITRCVCNRMQSKRNEYSFEKHDSIFFIIIFLRDLQTLDNFCFLLLLLPLITFVFTAISWSDYDPRTRTYLH